MNVFQYYDRSIMLKLIDICFSLLVFSTSYSIGAKIWSPSGDSSITAVQGESATLTWVVTLNGSDTSLIWSYVKVSQYVGSTGTDLVDFGSLGDKTVGNSIYQSRASDLTCNITQTGSVVTIKFTMGNLNRFTDEKGYKASLGFPRDFSTYPYVTFLNIQVIPESTSITITPNKKAFCNGSQVQINCTSHANPPAVYSLYRNNTLVENGSTSGYFIVTLNKVGNYSYTCVPSNAAGVGQNKSTEVLEVKEPPKINSCESDKTTTEVEGERFKFPCKISGSEPLNITWTNGTRVWNTKSLTFDLVNRRDAGNYNLTVSNGEECTKAERKNMTLDVYFIPESTSITITPYKKAFCNGSPIQINCTSHANPPAVYSLYRNDTLVQNGSTSGYFNVTLNKVGNYSYTCVPSNAAGVGQNKSTEVLEVKEPPKINSCESDKTTTVVEGKRFTFPCEISGSEPLTITWTNGTRVWNTKSLTFDPVNRTNNGTYNLTVSNGEECTKAERKNMRLDVYFKPESTSITITPNKSVFCNGSQIQIKSTSDAYPREVYSLYRNDTLVQNGSSSGYFTVTLNKVGNYSYTCVPSNEAGVGQNKSLYLMVKEPPRITNCESNQIITVFERDSFTFPCKISGSEPLTITWTGGTNEGNTKSLTFDPVNRTDNGTYNLTVSNGEECPKAERKNMTLKVYYKPESTSIAITPNKSVFCNGSQVQINCTSHAHPPAVYSLYRNDTLVQNGNSSGYFNVTLNKVGNYRYTCVPSNAAGVGQNKSTEVLEVKEPPKISNCQNSETITAVEGKKFIFPCIITGSEPLTITWTGGTKEGNTTSLTFDPVNRGDAGTYNLKVSNGEECPKAERKNMRLDVYFKPESTSITITPNKSVFCNGSQIQITCTSRANPTLQVYSLYRNNTLVQNGSSSGYFNVTLNKVGNYSYTCVPSNEAGVGQKKSLYLMVKEPPKISKCQNNETITAVEGKKFIFPCIITGSEPLTITWTDGTRVWNTTSLTFDPVNRGDAGTYNLKVSNGEECPKAERKNMRLDVYYKPESTRISPPYRAFCDKQWIQINCTSDARPLAKYSLYRNNQLVYSRNPSGQFSVFLNNTRNNTYTCVPNNKAGTGQNGSTHLFLHEPLEITNCGINVKSQSKPVTEGERVTLNCDISGSEELDITWTNGTRVLNKNRSLVFESVNRTDSGTYYMTVKGKECNKTKNASFYLEVYYEPEVTSATIFPNKTIFCNGSQVQINCTSRAHPPAVYSLYRNNTLVQNGSSSGYFIVTLNKVGNYRYTCVPSNEAGVGQNKSIELLKVEEPPKIVSCVNRTLTVTEGERVNVTCNISGTIYFTAWAKGLKPLNNNRSLIFESVSRNDSGNYSLTVSSGEECNITKKATFTLEVNYFNPANICNRTCISENVSAISIPDYRNEPEYIKPKVTCHNLNSKSVDTSYPMINGSFGIDATNKNNLQCNISNAAGYCLFSLFGKKEKEPIFRNATFRVDSITWKDDFLDMSNSESEDLVKLLLEVLWRIFKIFFCAMKISIKGFVKGSVWVNVQVKLDYNISNPFEPLETALRENDGNFSGLLINSASFQKDVVKTLPTTAPVTTAITVTRPPPKTIVIVVVTVVAILVLIIVIILAVYCYRRKCKRDKPLVENVDVASKETYGRDNPGLLATQSDYADRGPSHAGVDTANSGEVTYAQVNKFEKNVNDSGIPTYASVNRSQNGEIMYAKLEGFQENKGQPKGSHGDIALQSLTKGKEAKMPKRHEESHYAAIDFEKKLPIDEQGGDDGGVLSNSYEHSNPTSVTAQTGSTGATAAQTQPTGATTDSTNPEEQKNVVGEEKNKVAMPGDNQATQPPTQEDSADSLVSRSRNNTTLTTVSL